MMATINLGGGDTEATITLVGSVTEMRAFIPALTEFANGWVKCRTKDLKTRPVVRADGGCGCV